MDSKSEERDIPCLSKTEEKIMRVFWNANHPLTVSQVVSTGKTYNISLVQATVSNSMPNLMKQGFLEVDAIVTSGKNYAKSYKAMLSADEYMAAQLKRTLPKGKKNSPLPFFSFLLKNEKMTAEDLDDLSKIIDDMRSSR